MRQPAQPLRPVGNATPCYFEPSWLAAVLL
jgi:hypothetical protein